MNKDNQLYQLILEPAGDYQEGDWQIGNYRARPVKAQSVQLWRDLADDEPAQGGDRYIRQIELRQRPVPAQACACEGLRTALKGAQLRLDHYQTCRRFETGECTCGCAELSTKIHYALAQSCQPSVSHSVQQPDLSGSKSQRAGKIDSEKVELESRTSGVVAPPAQNLSEERGDATCPATARKESSPGSSAAPESFDPARVAADHADKYCEAQATPRTDAAVKMPQWDDGLLITSRQLERELNQANATVAALLRERDQWEKNAREEAKDAAALRRELAEAKSRLGWTEREAEHLEADRDQWKERAERAELQDKDEEAAQYAADHIFQPLMGEVTISDSQHRVIRNYAITVAKAALSHARATEEK